MVSGYNRDTTIQWPGVGGELEKGDDFTVGFRSVLVPNRLPWHTASDLSNEFTGFKST